MRIPMRKFITFLLVIFFCMASINAQNVTITKPQKKTTPASAGSTNDNTLKKNKKNELGSSNNSRPSRDSSQKTNSSTAFTNESLSYNLSVNSMGDTINGHEYVNLGLSVKWATCNVGASSPSDYGNYFAWGETLPKSLYETKDPYENAKLRKGISGNDKYDVARANWGSSWRLPSYEELGELIKKCKWIWTTMNGHRGYKVTGPNGNSIFLPAAGYRYKMSLYSDGERGNYWSYECYYNAYSLNFGESSIDRLQCDMGVGRSVRPVSE